jgi:hypothetical protein
MPSDIPELIGKLRNGERWHCIFLGEKIGLGLRITRVLKPDTYTRAGILRIHDDAGALCKDLLSAQRRKRRMWMLPSSPDFEWGTFRIVRYLIYA